MVRNWEYSDGFYLVAIGRKRQGKGKIYEQDQEEGWLLRAKSTDSDEGGVLAGFSVLDSLLLVDIERWNEILMGCEKITGTRLIRLTRLDVNCSADYDSGKFSL